jgi:hypothetical protein
MKPANSTSWAAALGRMGCVASVHAARRQTLNILFIPTDNLAYSEIVVYGVGITRGAATS